MDREQELQHLEQADIRIRQANKRISALEVAIALWAARGEDVSQASASLATWRDVLATFLQHREQIVRTLAEMDAWNYRIPGLKSATIAGKVLARRGP